MRDVLEGIEEDAILGALAEGWGLDAQSAEYAAVGAGSYHWLVTACDATRCFVTVDDLDAKLWLGDTRDAVFEGLTRAFDTARALRDHSLPFVVAPFHAGGGETVRRLGDRHTIALFPFLDGEAAVYGEHDAEGRLAVFELLARLHGATASVASRAASVGLRIPGRHVLDAALRDLDRPWTGGPLSEPAREGLARHAPAIGELLGLADHFAASVAARRADWVITYGEPHAGNVMRTSAGSLLVDWDTTALAPPERDLWMVAGDPAEAEAYAARHGPRDRRRGG